MPVDILHLGGPQSSGSLAARLLANGLNVNALRTNDVLGYDEWKAIDRTVLQAYQTRLVGVRDLLARNLRHDIPNGLGKTVLGFQYASDVESAALSMDGVTKSKADRPEVDIAYLPLPLVHFDFSFSIREIEASRNGSMPLDMSMAALAGRKCAEKVEEMLFTGASTYTFGGGSIYGFLDEPQVNTGSLTADWNDSGATGETILTDVRAMKQALLDDYCYGPYGLYVPTNYETALDDDFKANSDKSVRQRVSEISGVEAISVADKLTSDYVVLAQLTADVVRIVEGLPLTTIQWDTEGGMRINFKVMTIQIPQVRHDAAGRSGVAVFH